MRLSQHSISSHKSEEERIDHEHELCPHRLLHCVWAGCEEMVKAKDRRNHSEEHVIRTGVSLYTVPGKYTYKVKGKLSALVHFRLSFVSAAHPAPFRFIFTGRMLEYA